MGRPQLLFKAISASSLPKQAGPLEPWMSWRYLQEGPRSAGLYLSSFPLSSPLFKHIKRGNFQANYGHVIFIIPIWKLLFKHVGTLWAVWPPLCWKASSAAVLRLLSAHGVSSSANPSKSLCMGIQWVLSVIVLSMQSMKLESFPHNIIRRLKRNPRFMGNRMNTFITWRKTVEMDHKEAF